MEIVEKKNGCFLIENNRITDKRGWFQVAVNFEELRDMGVKFEQICHICQKYSIKEFGYEDFKNRLS